MNGYPATAKTLALSLGGFALLAACTSSTNSSDASHQVGTSSASATSSLPPAPAFTATPTRAPGTVPLPADTTLFPARGCGSVGPAAYATFNVAPDGTHPDCLIVNAHTRLRVFNYTNGFGTSGANVVVTLAGYAPQTLPPGQTLEFQAPLGTFFANGEHYLRISSIGDEGEGAIVWLKA